jgi:hypothetical protein
MSQREFMTDLSCRQMARGISYMVVTAHACHPNGDRETRAGQGAWTVIGADDTAVRLRRTT